jgi:hypothetical protein
MTLALTGGHVAFATDWGKPPHSDLKSLLDGLKHFQNYGTLDPEQPQGDQPACVFGRLPTNTTEAFIGFYRDKPHYQRRFPSAIWIQAVIYPKTIISDYDWLIKIGETECALSF